MSLRLIIILMIILFMASRTVAGEDEKQDEKNPVEDPTALIATGFILGVIIAYVAWGLLAGPKLLRDRRITTEKNSRVSDLSKTLDSERERFGLTLKQDREAFAQERVGFISRIALLEGPEGELREAIGEEFELKKNSLVEHHMIEKERMVQDFRTQLERVNKSRGKLAGENEELQTRVAQTECLREGNKTLTDEVDELRNKAKSWASERAQYDRRIEELETELGELRVVDFGMKERFDVLAERDSYVNLERLTPTKFKYAVHASDDQRGHEDKIGIVTVPEDVVLTDPRDMEFVAGEGFYEIFTDDFRLLTGIASEMRGMATRDQGAENLSTISSLREEIGALQETIKSAPHIEEARGKIEDWEVTAWDALQRGDSITLSYAKIARLAGRPGSTIKSYVSSHRKEARGNQGDNPPMTPS